jgi:16S rRNA (guanine527-N7)-methyltransferase
MTDPDFLERLVRRSSNIGVDVPVDLLPQLSSYYELLRSWNRRINLTGFSLDSPTDPALDRLILEPLAASRLIRDSVASWFDLGSGGGSPAIPLRLAKPALHLTMVESRGRKASFLREVIRELRLADVSVVQSRFEQLDIQPKADLVSIRAVKCTPELLAVLSRMLTPGGQAFLFGTEIVAPEGFEASGTHQLLGSATLTVLTRSDRSGGAEAPPIGGKSSSA